MNFFRKHWFLIILLILTIPFICIGCRGGGGSDDGGNDDTNIDPTPIGTDVCNQCHYAVPSNGYVAGDATDTNTTSATYFDADAKTGIGENYQKSIHYMPSEDDLVNKVGYQETDYVKCEGCHGNGSKHYGVNDIPHAKPGIDECGACHNESRIDIIAFKATGHANPNSRPDKYLNQGSNGTDFAMSNGLFLFKADKATRVTKNERIQECSVCHQYSNHAKNIAEGDLDNPNVPCAACHDPHQPASKNRNYLVTRGPGSNEEGPVQPEYVLNFKPQRVNNDSEGTQFGAKNTVNGTWIRPKMHYEYHVNGEVASTHENYAKQRESAEAGKDLLRLSSERLCASCHTKGSYVYSAFRGATGDTATAYSATHAPDTYTQYLKSGHADKNAQPFFEFSLLSAFGSGRRPEYPVDMGLSDGGLSAFQAADPGYQGKNNFQCYQCHHGIASIDYQNAVQGTSTSVENVSKDAHVLWGDSTVTCVTCHEPHKNGANDSTTSGVRVPVYLSYNSEFTTANPRGGANKMMDLTDIPSGAGNSIICLFCHQGRQSGWTLWKKVSKIQGNDFAYRSPNSTVPGFSTNNINYHYLGGGALLWSKNAWEFIIENADGSSSVPKVYSTGNAQHQGKNCTGCHMGSANSTNTEGGHTWVPRLTTCQTSGCHPGLVDFESVTASGDYDGDGLVETTHSEIGSVNYLDVNLGQQWGTGNGGTGLVGLLNEALYDAGVRYTPNHPYFTTKAGGTFSSWTPNLIAAAANLNFAYKTGEAMYVHNPHYVAQILIDSLIALGKIQSPTNNDYFRPAGTRNATDYRLLSPQ